VSRLEAHGLAVELVRGWEAEIGVRPQPAAKPGGRAESTQPVLHAANFALPVTRGEFGAGAVELMRMGHSFLALVEFGPAAVGSPLFDHPRPAGLRAADFAPENLQITLTGQAGCQRFFTTGGRAFCLYAVVTNSLLVTRVDQVWSTVAITPVGR
jgi:hypothetical protein